MNFPGRPLKGRVKTARFNVNLPPRDLLKKRGAEPVAKIINLMPGE
jgi:hypothetical protein